MSYLLSTYTAGRDNNFNLIRFIAASLVLFSHSFALALGSSDAEPMQNSIGMTWGTIAVDIFFITSGFLVTGSFFSRKNLLAFAWARILRIYPALVVAIIFCIAIGALFTNNNVIEYILDPQTHKYFAKNITLIFGVEFKLPGVFLDVPYKGAINGSLWTLPYEVKMYIILALILSLIASIEKYSTAINTKNILLILCVFSISDLFYRHFQGISTTHIRLFSMFYIGAVFFVWQDKIYLSPKYFFWGAPLLFATAAINKDSFFVAYCLIAPFLIFYAAYVPSGNVRKFNKYGDYSYGLYIYAFPVQQSIAAAIPNVSVSAMVATSFFYHSIHISTFLAFNRKEISEFKE